jgi:AcrR family transcriptional regulator
MGTLAGKEEGKGLPRGRHHLPAEEARARQRARILRATLSAVGELGHRATTMREIARRAHVSLSAVYGHFPDKETCVVTAVDEAMDALPATVEEHLAALGDGALPSEQLREAIRSNLAFFASEPELARAFHLELRAAGPEARERYFAILARFAERGRELHRRGDPEGAARTPDLAYEAAVGAIEQLVAARIHAGRTDELPELTDDAVRIARALAGRPGGRFAR